MDKLLKYAGKSDKGVVFTYVIDEERNYLTKTAAEYHPTIAAYINSAKKMPGMTQLLITALGASEWWSCFLEGTPIKMADGSRKNIELVEKDDAVITHKGNAKKVTNTFDKYYSGNVCEFAFSSWGETLKCTTEHPILSVKRSDFDIARRDYYKQKDTLEAFIKKLSYSFNAAEDLDKGDYVCIPFLTQEEQNWDYDLDWAYLCGWFLAEGCLVPNYTRPSFRSYKVILTLGIHEEPVANKIAEILDRNGKTARIIKKYQGNNAIRVEFIWSEFAQFCEHNFGKGSKNLFISSLVLTAPVEWQKQFLASYLEGDGYQVKAEGRYFGGISSSTASKTLAQDLIILAARIGYRAACNKDIQRSGLGYGNPIYTVTYQKGIRLPFETFFVPPHSQTSMVSYVDAERGYILVPIKNKDVSFFEGTVFNIEVDEDNSYCVSSIAVHNCNNNGDFFGEDQLAHEGQDYGFKTFETNARLYKHHVNRPNSQHYGKVILSVYNPVYHRVELIIGVDHALAPDIIEGIDQNIYPEFSMGTKIPYDICNICGNKAPNRRFYCDHLKYQLGTIDAATGRKVYAINIRPNFFDISIVIVPADKTAVTLKKVAFTTGHTFAKTAGGLVVGSALAAELAKDAADKQAAISKSADIEKEITSESPPATVDLLSNARIRDFVSAMPEMAARERAIPRDTLNLMARTTPLADIVSTMAMHMIMPKPQEFQRIYLISIGREHEADQLDKINACFDPSNTEPSQIHEDMLGLDPERFNTRVSSLLTPFMEERSSFGPLLVNRMANMVKQAQYDQRLTLPMLVSLPPPPQEEAREDMSLLQVLGLSAAMYAALSGGLVGTAIRSLGKAAIRHPLSIAATAAGVHSMSNRPGVMPHGAVKGNYSNEMYSFPDRGSPYERVEQMRERPYIKIGSAPEGAQGAALRRLLIGAAAIPAAAAVLQKRHESQPYADEGKVTSFIRKHPKMLSALAVTDAMLATQGRGTIALTHHLGDAHRAWLRGDHLKHAANIRMDEEPYPEVKAASVQDYAQGAVIWPAVMGVGNLPGRIVGGLIDQAALDLGGKLVDKFKKGKTDVPSTNVT